MRIYSTLRLLYQYIIKEKRRRYIRGLKRMGLDIANEVHIVDTFYFDPSHCFLISIGKNCTICPNVRLIAHDASTKSFLGYTKIGRIIIKENCFLGDSVIVLPNVTIGPNAIIGAGSVVTKNIPQGSIAGGNPAKVIGSLDSYLKKIKDMSRQKKIFSEDYCIEKLDEKLREEIIKSIGRGTGFIV